MILRHGACQLNGIGLSVGLHSLIVCLGGIVALGGVTLGLSLATCRQKGHDQ